LPDILSSSLQNKSHYSGIWSLGTGLIQYFQTLNQLTITFQFSVPSVYKEKAQTRPIHIAENYFVKCSIIYQNKKYNLIFRDPRLLNHPKTKEKRKKLQIIQKYKNEQKASTILAV
jgi:hypothetical protein